MIVLVAVTIGKLSRLFRGLFTGRCCVNVVLKPIAVVADNISTALEWLRHKLGPENIHKVNMATRRIDMKNGQVYVIVVNKEQARGFEFSSMVIAPDYETLIDVVKRRIR